MPTFDTLRLQPDRALSAARGALLRVESGTVWITASGAAGDLFLAAGASYRVPRAGKVLVEAVRGEAVVHLEKSGPRLISVLVGSCRAMLPKGMAMP